MLIEEDHTKTQVYFYIPGGESLIILYHLINKYNSLLVVITPSRTVVEVCKIFKINCVHPIFYEETNFSLIKKIKNFNSKYDLINQIKNKSIELFELFFTIFLAKKMSKQLLSDGIFYFSTFFYDSPGIIFFSFLSKRSDITCRLIWPSSIRFKEISKVPLFSVTFILNIILDNLFSFHLHPIGGRVVGLNPNFIEKKNIKFTSEFYNFPLCFKKEIKNNLLNSYNIVLDSKKINILFIGDYSVDHGISDLGQIYLETLFFFDKLCIQEKINLYYKPHPNYQSIDHYSLKNFKIIRTQIPLEFFDNGSWDFIIGFASAVYTSLESKNCISLIKMKGLNSKGNNIPGAIIWMENLPKNLIFPSSLEELEKIILTK